MDVDTTNAEYRIDPGFINYRKCFTMLGKLLIDLYSRQARDPREHWNKLWNDHLITDICQKHCEWSKIQPLSAVLINPKEGQIFCSNEKIRGNSSAYREHAKVTVVLPYAYPRAVFLEFNSEHFVCTTGRLEMSERSTVAIIGEVHSVNDNEIILSPLIIGSSLLCDSKNPDNDEALWLTPNIYEKCIEDIDEFAKTKEVEKHNWHRYMKNIPEVEVKRRFCEILDELPEKDWPGELADLFTSIHIGGKHYTAAFVLKGPGVGFKPMVPTMLGQNGDQIYRLASTSADVLVVQHCHSITPSVRETLKRFADTPHNPKRFCIIDGADTFRILKAYDKDGSIEKYGRSP